MSRSHQGGFLKLVEVTVYITRHHMKRMTSQPERCGFCPYWTEVIEVLCGHPKRPRRSYGDPLPRVNLNEAPPNWCPLPRNPDP